MSTNSTDRTLSSQSGGDAPSAPKGSGSSPATTTSAGASGTSSAASGAGSGTASAGAPASSATSLGTSGGTSSATSGGTAGRRAARAKAKGPRRVRLTVARVDPWSVMKLSFLLSVAAGIASVVLAAIVWMVLSSMGVFDDIDSVLASLQTSQSNPFSIKDYVGFSRVVSASIVLSVINVFLMTAIATVMAFLYNICSALVGGLHLTLTDD